MKTTNKISFTLLEVMLAISMLILTLVAIYWIDNQVKSTLLSTEDNITSLYLAQEWLEFVRNRRDYYITLSWNKETWWNKFLEEVWLSWKDEAVRIIETNKSNLTYRFKSWEIDDRRVSSFSDICINYADPVSESCIYEKITITKNEFWDKSSDWAKKDFFRKIELIKESDNLITIKTTIYWERKWEFFDYALESSLWNIAIY